MAKIQIYGDTNKGCIFFDNSSVEPKFLGTIIASIKVDEIDKIVIQRTDRYMSDGVTFRKLFRRLKATRVQNQNGDNLVENLGYSVQQVVDYINTEASNYSAGGAVRPSLDEHPNFILDDTNTTIMVDNGENFGVNTIKAILGSDGLIDIVSNDHSGNSVVHYEDCPHGNLQINGSFISGGPNDVVNALNELFTVGAFESVVISDPYSTLIADVGGIDAGYTLEGTSIDPTGTDVAAGVSTAYNVGGVKSVATIDQAGEYYTFDIRSESIIGFGLVLSDAADVNGNAAYGDPATFCNGSGNGNQGYQYAHFFHPTPNGPWTYYGANSGTVYGSGWTGSNRFSISPEGADWLAGSPVKIRVGIDSSSFISIEYYDASESSYIVVARSNYPVAEGVEFHLGIKFGDSTGRLYSAPKVHLLEPAAPVMHFRYIESPDGVYHYPLFTTTEEAEYYDEIHNGLTAGTGSSHTHTYADDPTNTTWYMPEASHDPTSYSYSVAPAGTETFGGNVINWTEVTSLTDSDLTPSQFSSSDYTYEEGTAVNLSLFPAGATFSQSVTISPANSGLVYNSVSGYLQGTLTDVGADTLYTVTVTRANSYGSNVGTFEIQATDVAPVQTNDTPWTKALDFSGSNERTEMVSTTHAYNPMMMGATSTVCAAPSIGGNTSSDANARPWATTCVFKRDAVNSNQHVWNLGEGVGTEDDNIYLRTEGYNGALYFGWGRPGALNEHLIVTGLGSSAWYGVYIGFNGRRLSGSDATSTNLASCFTIKLMFNNNNNWIFNPNPGSPPGSGTWPTTGGRMDRQVNGRLSIGGRGNNRNFHGKVASFVTTTIERGVAMPSDAEIVEMVTNPVGWLNDYKVGNSYRPSSHNYNNPNFSLNSSSESGATQVYLMGDGTNDSYSNMIRNQVNPSDQNFTKLNMLSMVSNDIETVSIAGLT